MIIYSNKDYCQTFAIYRMMTSTFNRTERLHTVHAMHTIAYLRSHVPESTEPEKWLPDSPDLNPVDYSVWKIIKDVYRYKISDNDQLKRVMIHF